MVSIPGHIGLKGNLKVRLSKVYICLDFDIKYVNIRTKYKC